MAITALNMHLWRVKLPVLPMGIHVIEVVSTDRNGLRFRDTIVVEVREERPPPYWRKELWE